MFGSDKKPPIWDRLAGWASAWKYVLILGGLLGLSIWLNLHQWKRAGEAPLRARIAAQDQALEDSAQINKDMRDSARELLLASDISAGTLQQSAKDYADARRRAPLTNLNCAPGAGRIDATNRALGAPITTR